MSFQSSEQIFSSSPLPFTSNIRQTSDKVDDSDYLGTLREFAVNSLYQYSEINDCFETAKYLFESYREIVNSNGDLEKAYIDYYKSYFSVIHTIRSHSSFEKKKADSNFASQFYALEKQIFESEGDVKLLENKIIERRNMKLEQKHMNHFLDTSTSPETAFSQLTPPNLHFHLETSHDEMNSSNHSLALPPSSFSELPTVSSLSSSNIFPSHSSSSLHSLPQPKSPAPMPPLDNTIHLHPQTVPQPSIPAPEPPKINSTAIPIVHSQSRSPSPDKLDPRNFKIHRKNVETNEIAILDSINTENRKSLDSSNDFATSLEQRFSRLRTNSNNNYSNSQVRKGLLDTNLASNNLHNQSPTIVPPKKEKTRYYRPLPMPDVPPDFHDSPKGQGSKNYILSMPEPNIAPEEPLNNKAFNRNNETNNVLPIPKSNGNSNFSSAVLIPKSNGSHPPSGVAISFSPPGSQSPTHNLVYAPHNREFNFPKTFVILPEELHKLLQLYPEQILIIDIRPREYFNNGHIPSSNVVCFEPVAIHSSLVVNDSTLEQALVLSPDHEQLLFKQRHKFPFVVYYDANTRSADFLNGRYLNEQDKRLATFIDYLYRKPINKALRRPPALLIGGLEGWTKIYGKDKIWKSATLPLDLPPSASASLNSIRSTGDSEIHHPNTTMPSFNQQHPAPLWKEKYSENNAIVAPKIPQVIPSRPYGSRKGSTASPNHRLSFDGSIPPVTTTAHDITVGTSSYNYARNTNDFFTMPTPTVPQSLQTTYSSSRPTTTQDLYSIPLKNGRHNRPMPFSDGTQRSDSNLPKLPPPVAHVPQSQSQYPHMEINSGYAMGHAPGISDSHSGGLMLGQLPPIQNMCTNGPGSSPMVQPSQNGQMMKKQPDALNQILRSFSTGLSNLGNTCYMNCIIQCVAATEKLARPIITMPDLANLNSKLGYKGVLYSTFSRLLQEMIRKDNSYVSPLEFRKLCGSLSQTFSGYQQQDCQEFLNFLLDGLHEELNRAGDKKPLKPLTEDEERVQEQLSFRVASAKQWKRYLYSNNSPISTLIQGQYLSRLTCTVCQTTSTTYNAFSCLSLPIPSGSNIGRNGVRLVDCFRLFTMEEVLDGDNAWHCPQCKKRRKTTKTMKITRLPEILIIHLKRFKQHGTTSNKLETFVSYPITSLDLTEFWVQPTTQADETVQHGGQYPPFLYNLYGVATHQGTLKGGHYTSFVKRGQNGWCYFDDTRVYRNVNPSHVVTQHAYVLFFERVRPVH